MSSSLYRGAVTTEDSTGVVSLLGQTMGRGPVGGGGGRGLPMRGTIQPQLQVLGLRPKRLYFFLGRWELMFGT